MMRPLSTSTELYAKNGGTSGTRGTAGIHAGFSRPTTGKHRWNTVGHIAAPTTRATRLCRFVPPCPTTENPGGTVQTAWILRVPLVPPVPPKKALK